jgi:hypothetical protein
MILDLLSLRRQGRTIFLQKSIQFLKTADNEVGGCVLGKKTDSSH